MTYRNLILCCAIIKKVLKILSYLNRILNEVIIQAISPKSSKIQGKSMELFFMYSRKENSKFTILFWNNIILDYPRSVTF